MVSLLLRRGRAPLFSLALVAAGMAGCESNNDGDGSGEGSTSGASDGSTTDPTPGTTGSGGTTTSEGSSSTTTVDESTTGSTTAADESSSSTSGEDSSSTGEICEPGTQNCVCDADTCEGDLECVDGVCFVPGGCQGKQLDTEPNQDEGAAQGVAGVNCGELAELEGSSEPDDIDWFSTNLTDLGEECPDSDGTIAIVTAAEDLELCMYFSCNAGAASVNCGPATDSTSPDGLSGCCGINSVEPDFFCSGVNSDSEVRLSVGGLEANACVDYAVAYRVL